MIRQFIQLPTDPSVHLRPSVLACFDRELIDAADCVWKRDGSQHNGTTFLMQAGFGQVLVKLLQ